MSGYTKYIPDSLVAVAGLGAAVLAARLDAFSDENGTAEVSCRWLCEVYGWSDGSMRNYARKLDVLQVWHISRKGDGRTHKTQWKKGTNFNTFFSQKGYKFCTKKGANFEPYNKNNKKEKINACAPAREMGAAQRGRNGEGLPLYLAGDAQLTSSMIDSMVMLRYKNKIAYCFERDLQTCLAGGARLFKPTN